MQSLESPIDLRTPNSHKFSLILFTKETNNKKKANEIAMIPTKMKKISENAINLSMFFTIYYTSYTSVVSVFILLINPFNSSPFSFSLTLLLNAISNFFLGKL